METKRKPLIFITNDDGVDALGLKTIINVAKEFGRVVAIAPETTQSGMSHAITMSRPLSLRLVSTSEDVEVYALSGTPVDCVKMAFDHLLAEETVDLTISGINHGSNSAINVLYSGTMGAAIEGSFYGNPSLGLSLTDHDANADFTAAAYYSRQLIADILASKPQTPMCLNVNIPIGTLDELKGIKLCRQCKGYWKEEFVCRKDPRGKDYYWLAGDFLSLEPEATDTDDWALANGYVSVVPIQIDLTNYQQMNFLNGALHNLAE